MKKLICLLITLIGLLGLTGCKDRVRLEILENTKYVTLDYEESMFKHCIADKPINPESYVNKSDEEREVYLAQYSIKLLGTIGKCNNQLDTILEYIKSDNDNLTNLNNQNEIAFKQRLEELKKKYKVVD